MSIQFIDNQVTQQCIKFKVNGKVINVTLTRNFCTWDLKGLEEMNLSFEELTEICKLIYSNRMITRSEDIVIHLKDSESIRFTKTKVLR